MAEPVWLQNGRHHLVHAQEPAHGIHQHVCLHVQAASAAVGKQSQQSAAADHPLPSKADGAAGIAQPSCKPDHQWGFESPPKPATQPGNGRNTHAQISHPIAVDASGKGSRVHHTSAGGVNRLLPAVGTQDAQQTQAQPATMKNPSQKRLSMGVQQDAPVAHEYVSTRIDIASDRVRSTFFA